MKLTSKSQHGLKVVGILVHNYRDSGNGYVQVAALARNCQTSQKYLEQVLVPLSRAGILYSKRGQHGGYCLNWPPENVSLAQVLRCLEGLLMPIPSWAEENGERSAIGDVLFSVRESIRAILEETSICVLAERRPEASPQTDEAIKEIAYYI